MIQTLVGIGILVVALTFGFSQWLMLRLYNQLGDELAESDACAEGRELPPSSRAATLARDYVPLFFVTVFPILAGFLIVEVGMALGAP